MLEEVLEYEMLGAILYITSFGGINILEKSFNQYIRTIEFDINEGTLTDNYPYSLKAVRELPKLELNPNVTFIIGENGSGKSTLLEAIAVAYGFNPEGGSKNFNFSTKDTHSILSQYIRITKGVKKVRDGYFFRAESFYNLASNIDELDDGIQSYHNYS